MGAETSAGKCPVDVGGDFHNVTLLGHTPLKFHFLQLHLSSFGWFIPSERLVCNSRKSDVDWIVLLGCTLLKAPARCNNE